MRYVIGYQLPDELDSTWELCNDFSDAISGVYFSLPGAPSARSVIDPSLKDEMLEELKAIRALDKKLVLLYNANCYGSRAASPEFRAQLLEEIEFARRELGVCDVTTASPFVAKVLKEAHPDLDICASVNMRVGTIQAMRLLTDFDSFYLQREYIYDFARIEQLKRWCNDHGKALRLIANSGCLYDCPFHTWHDNLVAHEAELHRDSDVMGDYPSPCWEAMAARSDTEAAALFLQGNWIRPEDIHAWEPWFSEAKLATRMHSLPRRVVAAYAKGRCKANLLDLTEPSYSTHFQRAILDATRLPADFFQHKSTCGHRCDSCDYCLSAARAALYQKTELERTFLRNS